MKLFMKKIYLTLFLLCILSINTEISAKDSKNEYFKENFSNYFSGSVSYNNSNAEKTYEYLNKIKKVNLNHKNYNKQYIHSLVLLKRFKQVIDFSQKINSSNNSLFEVDLLLGINSFIKEDYTKAKKYFANLNQKYQQNNFYTDFLEHFLLSWTEAAQNNKEKSFYYFDQINQQYYNLKRIQNSLLLCYFDTSNVEITFQELINDKSYVFSRYNFFLGNYLLHKNKKEKAKEIISNSSKLYDSNILLKQAENFIKLEKSEKITNFFNCENPKDNIAEIFYILSNLYASEKNYNLSNFYLNISFLLNNKFIPNKALLAENLFYEKKFKDSKRVYDSLKSIGSIYSWYASKSISTIISQTEDVDLSILNLEKEFNLLNSPNFQNYYEMANFYKDRKYHKKAIDYYSIALEKINEDHTLVPKILYRRGTSYERLDKWSKAETDLKKSLEIFPDQPFVLNYLAYSWTEKKINIKEALQMLKLATELEEGNGYILDSLGWAHYANKDYILAENFLQQAVELMPLESVINDHYADTLWMLNKPIQARYFWKQVLDLGDIEKDLEEKVSKKLVFGLVK
jgi:tetratricopeptide (TPR) repeat protein